MRLLADENFDPAIIQALRDAGHEVRAIRETNAAAPDEVVIEIALNERRVLLTEGKDFGQLVYSRAQRCAGVVLVRRFASPSPQAKASAVVEVVAQLGEELAEKFVVVEPGRIRVGRSPG